MPGNGGGNNHEAEGKEVQWRLMRCLVHLSQICQDMQAIYRLISEMLKYQEKLFDNGSLLRVSGKLDTLGINIMKKDIIVLVHCCEYQGSWTSWG